MREGIGKVQRSRAKATIRSFRGGVNYSLDQSVLPLSVSSDSFNFDFSGGALTEGYGLEAYSPFQNYNLTRVWLYKRYDHENEVEDDRLLAITQNGWLLEEKSGVVKRVGEQTFSGKVGFINYRLYGEDVCLIASSEGMFVYDGASHPYRVDNAPRITSMALHGERLFVTTDGEKNSVWFSDDLDPTNWTVTLEGGGFIQMLDERGKINKVLEFAGYIYCFRDYGISRISGYGEQTDFAVSNLFVSGGRIYAGSVTVCGDKIILLAEDGLYAFDGVSTSKILSNLDGLIESGNNACALYYGGKYYLAFRRKKDGEVIGSESEIYRNNGLLVLDTEKGDYALSRGMDITSLCKIDGEGVVAVTRDGRAGLVEKCGSLYGVSLKKKWVVPKTDLGSGEKKRIREVTVYAECPVEIIFRTDEREKKVKFSGKSRVEKKRLNLQGYRVGAEFITVSKSALISAPSFEFTK